MSLHDNYENFYIQHEQDQSIFANCDKEKQEAYLYEIYYPVSPMLKRQTKQDDSIIFKNTCNTRTNPSYKDRISLAEIVQGHNSSVRVTSDRLLHAVDLVTAISENSRDYASQVIRGIPDDVFDSGKFIKRQLSSHGGHPTKLLTVEDSIQFIMVLPGKMAKQIRKRVAEIIWCHFTGEPAIFDAILKHPVVQTTHNPVEARIVKTSSFQDRKRRREEISQLAADYEKICTNTILDEQAKSVFKKKYLDLLADDS